MSDPVVVLAGGTGGAKLARGMLDVAGDDLVVIANPGDDIEIHGALVSPDPDLITFWLADAIDARGWGLEGDTFEVMNGLRALGRDVWFNLGDRDLAWCLERSRMLAEGLRPTEAHAVLARALGVGTAVLPACDEPVRTRVCAGGRWQGLQEFLIRGGDAAIEDVAFEGVDAAAPTPEVLDAVRRARAIVIGPSNPVISIGPILALPGMRGALRAATAPVVAVSPIVAGAVLKGPTAAFLAWLGLPTSAEGIARAYDGVIDGLLSDEECAVAGVVTVRAPTLMGTADERRRVARAALDLAERLHAP